MDPPGSCVPLGPPLDDPEAQYTRVPHHSLSWANAGGGISSASCAEFTL